MTGASGRARQALALAITVLIASAACGAATATADTFTYTGSEQIYTVPAGATALHVVLVGADGAAESIPDIDAAGGRGARLDADIPVLAGMTTLYVEVGGNGVAANPPSVPYTATGGFNGGGGGPLGGGGASDIRTVPSGQPESIGSRLAVAGGGGGAGGNAAYNANGGDAGSTDGSGSAGKGLVSGTGASTEIAGQAVDQATVTSYCQDADPAGNADGERGDAGTLGAGGGGAFLFISDDPTSGGGGGGLYGGGGGAQCYGSPGAAADEYAGAGGGGSSGAPGGQNVQIETDSTDPAEVIITAPVPANTAPPSISGGLTVGDVLAESHGTWSTSLTLTGYAYQWQRCDAGGGSCAEIDGATGQTYTLRAGDLGHTLRVRETASNLYGAASATSVAGGVVLGQPPTTIDPPTIAGTATAGQLLVATHAPWGGGPITGYADQWQRCDSFGASCQPIAGAVNQTYTLTAADVGSTMRVQETATNRYGTSLPVRSAPTATVHATANSAAAPHLRRGRTRFDGHSLLVKLTCASAGAACRGSIELRSRKTAVAQHHGKTHRHELTVVVGVASYSIGPGRSRTISVHLNRNGGRLLEQLHNLPTRDSITLVQAAGKDPAVISFTMTLTAPGKKRHR